VKTVRFHRAARDELAGEVLYYAAFSSRVGERFVAAVEQAIQLASEFPGMGSPYQYGTRRVFPGRFPFSVVYLDRSDDLYILALAPFSKRPGYWRSRKTGASIR
jgi:plasmid stabilization system protein ParE